MLVAEPQDWVGKKLAGGRYLIRALLGEGGMGLVFRAWDHHLGTEVVVKIPRPTANAKEFCQRFTHEVRSLVSLSHPHIVKILDVGEQDRLPFAVLQYLAGGNLEDERTRLPGGDFRPLAAASLRRWVSDVAKALDFIHGQGYIHRDVKPANILFDAHGNAFLSDFGVAKALAAATDVRQTALTGSDLVLGTPHYMAPELVLGHAMDGRADQYALAVTVFELLAGRPPIDGPTGHAIMVKQTIEPAPPLTQFIPGSPDELTWALARALSKSAKERFASCSCFAESVLAATANIPGERPVARPAIGRVATSAETKFRSDTHAPLPPPVTAQLGRIVSSRDHGSTISPPEPDARIHQTGGVSRPIASVRSPANRSAERGPKSFIATIGAVLGGFMGLALGAMVVFYFTGLDVFGLSATSRLPAEKQATSAPPEQAKKIVTKNPAQNPDPSPVPAPLPSPASRQPQIPLASLVPDSQSLNAVPPAAPIPQPHVPLLASVPKAIVLPPIESDSPNLLVPLPQVSQGLQLAIHPDLADLPAGTRIQLDKQAEQGNSAWLLNFVLEKQNGTEQVAAARIRNETSGLTFAWEESVTPADLRGQLCNCILELRHDKEVKSVQLREVARLDALVLNFDKDKTTVDVGLKNLPLINTLSLRIEKLEHSPGAKLRGNNQSVAIGKSAFIDFTDMPGTEIEVRFFRLAATKPLSIVVDAHFDERGKPKEDLTFENLSKTEEHVLHRINLLRAKAMASQNDLDAANSTLNALRGRRPNNDIQQMAIWDKKWHDAQALQNSSSQELQKAQREFVTYEKRRKQVPVIKEFLDVHHRKAQVHVAVVATGPDKEIVLASTH